ncbi:hypothetical protein [Paenibacillus silvae]|uniref:WD40 repeat domain-containing protein n=1 Tax=Paenibacillus silvae TaxID=1325358 RepID=A0A2W6PDT8_9BACL|nr:hypothetical protein [Paenibacillus silvae]PZT56246.1 hypothetical protein DN757_08015 [Paenibacillus silvae]
MKAVKILLSGLLVTGGFTAPFGVSPASAFHSGEIASPIAAKESLVDFTLYDKVPKFKKTVSFDKVIWTGNHIKLVANIVEDEHVPAFESKVIESIVITKGKVKHTIKTDHYTEKLHEVQSVVHSKSGNWVSIQASKSAGYAIILVNLKTGESRILNDLLVKAGKKGVESIPAWNWSPEGDKIAISYGNTEKSSLAVYDANAGAFEYLPRTTNYISTGLVLWHINGKALDYISEYPSDQMSLYRYNAVSNKVKLIKKITLKEFQQFLKLDKPIHT